MASKIYPSVRPKAHRQDVNVADASTDKFDQHMQRFQGKGGSLRGHPGSIRKIILSLGAKIRGT